MNLASMLTKFFDALDHKMVKCVPVLCMCMLCLVPVLHDVNCKAAQLPSLRSQAALFATALRSRLSILLLELVMAPALPAASGFSLASPTAFCPMHLLISVMSSFFVRACALLFTVQSPLQQFVRQTSLSNEDALSEMLNQIRTGTPLTGKSC